MPLTSSAATPQLTPGLAIVHANHMEDLKSMVVRWIGEHPLNPLEQEVFVVQSNGMAQWLKLALAADEGCGISASLDFQLPSRFLWQAYRAVLGKKEIPPKSPYDKDRLIWRLMKILSHLESVPLFAALSRFLDPDPDSLKTYQLAYQLADLYDQYQMYRADWLLDWGSGKNTLRDARGRPGDLPADQMWQAELWRRIQGDIPRETRYTSRSALHLRFLEGVARLHPPVQDLPQRVVIFGISSLPRQFIEAVHALSRLCQVLMCVLNPCQYYWGDIIEDKELLRGTLWKIRHQRKPSVPENLAQELLHQYINPLLAAWGKQGRDYIGLLSAFDQPETYRSRFAEIDLFRDYLPQEGEGPLLKQVQQSIYTLAPLPSPSNSKPRISTSDESLVFHLAHTRQREVEILYDQLLSYFERMPHLKPRDIIVMTPDIGVYAPFIEGVFSAVPLDDIRYIPYTIADRPEKNSRPLLNALEKLLSLPESRFSTADITDLLEVEALRSRFDICEEDLPQLFRWIKEAGIRWGLHGAQRRHLDLPAGLEQYTWFFGLRRMLLGYAVGSGEPFQGIEPYDEIGGLEARLVGNLSLLLEKLEQHWQRLRASGTVLEWGRRIYGLVDDFFKPVTPMDQVTLARIYEGMDAWQDAAEEAEFTESVPLTVVRDTLLGAVADASISQRFLAGRVNFCTLMPMRAIPFRVVCLLGMNDGEFPRSRPPLDFDLMAAKGHYRPGDRSRREDDRYLFLEALLSAREKLYISYIGRDAKDNSPRVPSVLISQLRDYLAQGWEMASRDKGTPKDSLIDALTYQHPLQPFGKAYFQSPRDPRMMTYAHEWQSIYQDASDSADSFMQEADPFEGHLTFSLLARLLQNPVQTFFNHRLKIFFEDPPLSIEEREPFTLDSLAAFELGLPLLEKGRAADPGAHGAGLLAAAGRLKNSGSFPMGGFGELEMVRLTEPLLKMLEKSQGLDEMYPDPLNAVEINWAHRMGSKRGLALIDWLDGLKTATLDDAQERQLAARWEYYPLPVLMGSRLSRFKPLIRLWVQHVAGCARNLALISYLVCPDCIVKLTPVETAAAVQHLDEFLVFFKEALNASLPVTGRTAFAYLDALMASSGDSSGGDAEQKALRSAQKAYEGDGFKSQGEVGYDAYLKRIYPDFQTVLEAAEPSFAELARRMYLPVYNAIAFMKDDGPWKTLSNL